MTVKTARQLERWLADERHLRARDRAEARLLRDALVRVDVILAQAALDGGCWEAVTTAAHIVRGALKGRPS